MVANQLENKMEMKWKLLSRVKGFGVYVGVIGSLGLL